MNALTNKLRPVATVALRIATDALYVGVAMLIVRLALPSMDPNAISMFSCTWLGMRSNRWFEGLPE